MTQPYTYLLRHRPTGLKYYGVRWAKGCSPDDLWVKYFTSSRYVKELIKQYGQGSFDFEIRKVFSSKEKAICWEEKVLRRLNVHKREDWLNVCVSKSIRYDKHPRLGVKLSQEVKDKISKSNKGKPKWSKKDKKRMSEQRSGEKHWNYGKTWSEESKQKMRESNIKYLKENPDKVKMPPDFTGKKHTEETKQKMAEARRKYWADRKSKE